MEPWEDLDLDYSDVHSLLRPLKSHRSPQPLSASAPTVGTSTLSLPLLKSCSRPPTQCQSPSDNHQPDLNVSSENPICQSQRISTELEAPCSSAASSSLIPGPAGAVQAAMQRRTRGDNCFYLCDEEAVPTQEYIRRVIENGDEEDDDFNGNPWLCALDFVRGLGAMEGNGAVSESPLNSIKNGFNAEKVALVVAIIKSCTPNGLGGMMVTLKDPTGTMGASIHHRVISEGSFGKDLSVGAVLILQKVAVFSPTRFVHVLNVTSSNVIKVVSKDSGPPIKHNHPTSAIRQPDSISEETHGEVHMPQKNFDVSRETTENILNNLRQSSKLRGKLISLHSAETHGEVHMPQKNFDVSSETTENIMNNLRQSSKLRGSGLGDPQTGKGNAASSSSCKGNGNYRNQQTVVEKEGVMNLGMSKEISSLDFNTFLVDQDQETGPDEHMNHQTGTDTGVGELSQAKGNDAASNAATQVPNNRQEAERMNEAKKTETRTPGPFVPQWTDEQLDELFVFD